MPKWEPALGLDPRVQGVSTRKVKAITEELCGHAFSASAVSAINKCLDESLDAFARRSLAEPFPYLILDARYEKVREGGVVPSQAVLIPVGIDWDGRRQILAVDMANRESGSSWKDFLLALRRRGLDGVEFVVADDHAGLRSAIREVLPEAAVQRCYVHFLRNALDHLPHKADDDACRSCAGFTTGEMSRKLVATLPPGSSDGAIATGKLVDWVEETIEETFTFYRLPRQHHKHLKSTNMLERLNEEIKRRTHVVRIFPNATACLRLVRALAPLRRDRIAASSIPGDDPDLRVQRQPTLGGGRLPIGQQRDRRAPFKVARQSAAALVAPPGPVVNAHNRRRRKASWSTAAHQAQKRVVAHHDVEPPRKRGRRPASERNGETVNDVVEPARASGSWFHRLEPFGKDPPRAGLGVAEEAAGPQNQCYSDAGSHSAVSDIGCARGR